LLLSLLLGLTHSAEASDYIASVGEEITLGPGGGWVRLFPDTETDGWHFLWAAGGDFIRLPMSAALEVKDRDRQNLTGRTDLVDHAITRCPSGGYLHVASANKESFNDSAYAFRYDENFDLLSSGTLEEVEPSRKHNDLPVLCTPILDATAFIGSSGGAVSLSVVSEDASQSELISLGSAVPRTTGGSLRMDTETGELVVIGKDFSGQAIAVVGLDENYDVTWEKSFQPLEDASLRPYWPQALLQVKEHYLLAFMARDESAGWGSDWGNVYLAVLDANFEHLETVQVSQYSPPEGAQRPGLARRGTQVLLTVDRNVQPQLFEIRLLAEAFGLSEEDDTGAGWDTSSSGQDPSASSGCGCSSSRKESASWWILLGICFGLTRRRASGRARGLAADRPPGDDTAF